MALTLPANYISALGQGFQESWLVEISNTGGSGGSSDYIRLGTEEVIPGAVSNDKYHPFILNAPSIRESIDLEKGTSKTSNISIVCHNGTLANHSQSLSKEILNQGTRFYLNHQVTIKSKVGSISSGDWLTIFTGRLKDVKVNDNHQVTLSIASATPIDFVKIPQYQSNSGNFYPIVYGDYKNETSTKENPDHIDDDTAVKVFPVQVDRIAKNNYNCLVHTALTDEVLHYPLKDAFRNSDDYPIFAPIETSVNAGFLNEDLTSSETGIDVSNGGNFSSGDIILIDREQMKVSSVSSNTLTVTRGFNSTTAAIHSIYSPVYIVQNAISSINTYESDTADTNRNVLQTSLNLLRTYRYRPSIDSIYEIVGDENVALDPFAPTEIYPKENMVDTNTSSYHQFVHTATSTASSTDKNSNDYYAIKLNIAKEEHYIREYKVYVKFDISSYTLGFTSGTQPEYEIMAQCRVEFAGGNEVENGIAYDAIQTDKTETFVFSTDFTNFNGATPTSVEIRFWFRSNDMYSSETSTSTIRVDDIWIETTAEIIPESDTNANPMEQQSAVTSVDTLYCGADGLTKSFSSGVVTNIVDMHRDLLSRFTGIAGSGATIRVNGGNSYSDLTTARSSWKCEYWTNKEEEVNDLLEKAQFEGGFIFRFRSSDENPQYIYIANGTPTADHIIDLEDISSFDLSMTPIDKLVTKRIIKYQRSPINDKHIKEQTSEDTTNSIRSNYNIQTNENIETNTLDILVGGIGATNTGTGNRNDGFANYYASINGKPKYIVGLEIINSQSSGASKYFYGMEVGDYCKFSTSVLNNLSTFSGIDTTTIFIVTDITRTLGSLKVTLRQI